MVVKTFSVIVCDILVDVNELEYGMTTDITRMPYLVSDELEVWHHHGLYQVPVNHETNLNAVLSKRQDVRKRAHCNKNK